jgi:oligoendopeptidase F
MIDYPTFDALDWASVQPRVDALLTAELTPQSAAGWLEQWGAVAAVLYEAQAQVYRDTMEDTTNADADRRFQILVNEILPKMRVAEQALRDKLLALEGYEPAPEHELLVRRFRAQAAIFSPENVPLISQLMTLENDFEKIMGGLMVDLDGEQVTVPAAAGRLRMSADRSERERAWRAMMASYLAQRERLNELYLHMLKLRRQVAANSGLPDFRAYKWQELARFDYTPEDCFTFHDAIEREAVPLATRIYEQRARALGVERLRPWDTHFDPYGEPIRPFTEVAELEEGCQRIFDRLDPVLSDYFRVMRDGNLDLASRPNKGAGGFCDVFPVSGKPYIFMNAVGSTDDVGTLLHEGGHAFHFMSSKDKLFWNQNGPMEFCEVASMSMELLAAPYLKQERGGFYSRRDAARTSADHLEEIVTFLPYMAVVDAFQHWVYTEAPEDVSAAEMDAKWSELWDRFMPGVDYSGLQEAKETGWHRKVHIFSSPFYYIEYGLAQLGALQIWRNSLADPAHALRGYRNALSLGFTRGLPDLFAAADARFAFDRTTLKGLMALTEAEIASARAQVESVDGRA